MVKESVGGAGIQVREFRIQGYVYRGPLESVQFLHQERLFIFVFGQNDIKKRPLRGHDRKPSSRAAGPICERNDSIGTNPKGA